MIVPNTRPGAISKRRILPIGVGVLCGASLLAPLAAMGQEAQTTNTAAGELEQVLVTGSRLIRSDLAAPSPLTVIGEDVVKLSGSVTIENTLNEFPQLASGNTSSVNSGGGSGVLTANLRGLGATRTLTLVNGRRFIPANSDGQVDLASIPDALVERVEVITGGASAVYGSDAIAGAVNFMLRDDFEGVEVNYQFGETFEGDGGSQKADLTFGGNFAEGRGNAVFSLSYTKRDPVYQSDRRFSRVPLDTVGNQLLPGGSSAIPGTRIGLSSSQLGQLVGVDLTPGGACTTINGVRFGENGTVEPYCNPQDAYNYADLNYLLRPLERTQATALGRYDLNDRVEVYAEAFLVNSRNAYQQAPDSATPVTPGAGAGILLVPNYANNPGLSASVRDFFMNNAAIFDPNGTGTASIQGAGRRYDELGPRVHSYERNSLSFTTGLRGDFEMLSSNWNWDTFFQYQRNRADNRTTNMISGSRLSLGLDTVLDGDGNVVCRSQVLGCVPVNIFGLGSISPEAAGFIAPVRASDEEFTRKVAGATLSGELFDLPAGPVAMAVGVEYREDGFEFNPSPLDVANEYGSVSLAAMDGSFDVAEVFTEFRVPILSRLPWADTLAFEGAARYSDYGGDNSTVGGVVTWKAGLEYAPVDWVRFRTAVNQAIRAPTINELKSPVTTGFATGVDPCVASRNPTPEQQQLCIAQGVPAADLPTFTQANVGFEAFTGGNPNLKEEESETFTIGVVLTPHFVPGLNIAVDYFTVKVEDAIARINADQTLNDCFARLDPNAATCRSIDRFSNGQISFISTQLNNIGLLKVEGVDAQVDYGFELPFAQLGGSPARLNLSALAGWLFERSTSLFAGQQPVDCAGRFGGGCTGNGVFGTPDFKLNLSATYASGPLMVRMNTRMLGGMQLYPGVNSPVRKASEEWYVDLTSAVEMPGGVELIGGVNNVLDNQPPILGTALAGDTNTDPSLYDVIGRRYFIGARMKF